MTVVSTIVVIFLFSSSHIVKHVQSYTQTVASKDRFQLLMGICVCLLISSFYVETGHEYCDPKGCHLPSVTDFT